MLINNLKTLKQNKIKKKEDKKANSNKLIEYTKIFSTSYLLTYLDIKTYCNFHFSPGRYYLSLAGLTWFVQLMGTVFRHARRPQKQNSISFTLQTNLLINYQKEI